MILKLINHKTDFHECVRLVQHYDHFAVRPCGSDLAKITFDAMECEDRTFLTDYIQEKTIFSRPLYVTRSIQRSVWMHCPVKSRQKSVTATSESPQELNLSNFRLMDSSAAEFRYSRWPWAAFNGSGVHLEIQNATVGRAKQAEDLTVKGKPKVRDFNVDSEV